MLGNGESTLFWKDPWVPKYPDLSLMAKIHIFEDMVSWKVSNFVTTNRYWDWPKLNQVLRPEAINQISGILPPSYPFDSDRVNWSESSDGNFYVKSAYSYLSRLAFQPSTMNWNLAWKWEGPQRIKTFLWLLMGNNLLTNERRLQRHLADSATCPRCKVFAESSLHAVRDCEEVKNSWKKNQMEQFLQH